MARHKKNLVINEEEVQFDVIPVPADPKRNRVKYPLWDKDELLNDIDRAKHNIGKFEEAIEEQRNVIEERKRNLKQVDARDRALAAYAAEIRELEREHGKEAVLRAIEATTMR